MHNILCSELTSNILISSFFKLNFKEKSKVILLSKSELELLTSIKANRPVIFCFVDPLLLIISSLLIKKRLFVPGEHNSTGFVLFISNSS